MKVRTASLLLLVVGALAAPGCEVYHFFQHLGPGDPFSIRADVLPPDFKFSVQVSDVAVPPKDYLYTFERSGKATYDVVVRKPRRKQGAGTFEITEDQIKSLWNAVATARFDELDARYPDADDGPDKANGVQLFYVYADEKERRVESHFQANEALESIRAAAIAVVPREIHDGNGFSGRDNAPPKEYVGDATSHLFHRPDCVKMKDLPPANRRPFGSPYDALNDQFQPCPECNPMPSVKPR